MTTPEKLKTLAQKLLQWNREHLVATADLESEQLEELFAPEFVVKANGRTYEANYANYFVFLNDFRQDIQSIDYKVDDYICGESKVAMPLSASVVRTYGGMDKYEAVLVLEFNKEGKIVLWQEIYAPCET